jgi:hypothetical protein
MGCPCPFHGTAHGWACRDRLSSTRSPKAGQSGRQSPMPRPRGAHWSSDRVPAPTTPIEPIAAALPRNADQRPRTQGCQMIGTPRRSTGTVNRQQFVATARPCSACRPPCRADRSGPASSRASSSSSCEFPGDRCLHGRAFKHATPVLDDTRNPSGVHAIIFEPLRERE